MHMGPGHPVFAGRGGGGSGGGPPGPPPGLPPGARWDPVAPEGLPGFRPADFQRPPPGRFGEPHPDVEFMPGRDPGGHGCGVSMISWTCCAEASMLAIATTVGRKKARRKWE